MGKETEIAWTDSTANWWWGCVKVSEGCQHCYAESLANRWGKSIWGPAATTEREYKKAAWKDVPKWNAEAKAAGVRRRVFVQSMSDFFEDHPQVAPWRAAGLHLMQECRHLDFQVLTKRPENINRMIEQATGFSDSEMWFCTAPHVWIGTTVENQEQADKRIPHLIGVPARVRFLSCEPLLGYTRLYQPHLDAKLINWVICGGESGPGARPMHPEWARSLRNQCQAANVPYFFKQWGEWLDQDQMTNEQYGMVAELDPQAIGGVADFKRPSYLFPTKDSLVYRIGKKAAGRLLDGVEYSEFPA